MGILYSYMPYGKGSLKGSHIYLIIIVPAILLVFSILPLCFTTGLLGKLISCS